MSEPTQEEMEAVRNRRPDQTDPTLIAVCTLVEEMCNAAIMDATGFTVARVTNEMRDFAKAKFIIAMERIEAAARGTEG